MAQHIRSKSTSNTYRPIAPFIAPSTTNSWRLDNQRELRTSDGASLSPVTNQFHIDDNMDDSIMDQKTRRKEQNRAAQRAFRERKEKYVKELETKIKQMEIKHNKALASKEKEIETLRHKVAGLENELNKIKGIHSDHHDHNNHHQHIEMTTSALKATRIHDEDNNHNNNDDDTINDLDNNSNNTNSDDTMMMLINDDDDTDSELHDLDMMESRQNNHNHIDDDDDDDNGGFLKLLPKYHQFKKPPSSAVACIRDKDGVSFCERLKEEVCSSAYNQLLSEPLFDASGTFNEKVTDHPVPIVTENLPKDHPENNDNNNGINNNNNNNNNNNRTISFLDRLNETLINDNFDFSSPHPDTLNPNNELVSCSKAWRSLSTHSKFDVIDVDALCTELKKIAKCSNDGPVFSQHDLNFVLKWMDTI